MVNLGYAFLSLHYLMLTILCLFGLHRLSMVIRWLIYRKVQPPKPDEFTSLPKVTIQVPLYNERLVAERAIHAVACIDYPQDKLQIHIVDDSTDETQNLVAKVVGFYAEKGINIQHIHRTNRQGFKAGALKEAMPKASGEFIAIFDADFIPAPSIIKETIHQFTNNKVAMVQFRWGHLNRYDSRLTETQAMMLDSHFALEQHVRFSSNALFNFNGTAGIWRTDAIVDAGNWSADTLTEDLDLSYRAQLKGWKLVYLNHIECAGEIPADMNAFKSQQHRWAKGGIQVMKKMLRQVWASKIKLRYKVESTFHLANNLAYFVMLFDTTLFLIPSLVVRDHLHLQNILWVDFPMLLLSSGGHLVYFFFGQVALNRSKLRALKNMPRVLLLGIQLAFNNAKAAVEALAGQQSEFVRTPKAGYAEEEIKIDGIAKGLCQKSIVNTGFYQAISPKGGGFEVLLGIVYLIVFIWGLYHELWLMLPFLLLLVIGFLSTAANTLKRQFEMSKG